jgi:hypothetical protein
MRALIELIDDLVNEGKPWKEKHQELLALASKDEVIYLEEFASWFESE